MSCCSNEKKEKRNVEMKSNEQNIEETKHGHREGGQSDKTSDPADPRTLGHESANIVRITKQSTEEKTR